MVKVILFIFISLIISACSVNYKFGNISKNYCQSTNPELRAIIKEQLSSAGVDIGVDFCATRGFIDAMIDLEKSN